MGAPGSLHMLVACVKVGAADETLLCALLVQASTHQLFRPPWPAGNGGAAAAAAASACPHPALVGHFEPEELAVCCVAAAIRRQPCGWKFDCPSDCWLAACCSVQFAAHALCDMRATASRHVRAGDGCRRAGAGHRSRQLCAVQPVRCAEPNDFNQAAAACKPAGMRRAAFQRQRLSNQQCWPHFCRHAGPAITTADTAEDRSEFKLRFYRVG